MRTVLVDHVTGEIISSLREAGVRCIVLKGPSFASWLYPDPTTREYLDTDLLVAPSDVALVGEVLTGLGFAPRLEEIPVHDAPGHARAWMRRTPFPAAIDVHETLAGITVPPAQAWAVLSAHAEPGEVAGFPVEFLDEPARALHAALHVAQGSLELGHAVDDLTRAATTVNLETWRQALELATRLGARDALSAGLRCVPAGVALATELGLSPPASIDVRLRSSDAPQGAVAVAWALDELSGPRQKLAWIARKVFPSRRFVLSWSLAVRRRRSGVMGAYLFRWRWLAHHAPGALRAVRRARGAPGEPHEPPADSPPQP